MFIALVLTGVLACTLVLEGVGAAEDTVVSGHGRTTAPAQPASDWNALLSLGYLPPADLHGVPASVGISDYRFRLARNLKIDNELTLTLGGGYGLKHLDAPANAILPQDLHSIYLEAGATYRINEKSFVTLKLYPGLNSDFNDIANDDLRLPMLLLGGHAFNSGITLVGGFAYRLGYHAAVLIPVIGISYQPNDKWRVDLIAPRPGVTYSASRQVRLFIAGDFASDEYELHDSSLGARVIRYRDYKAIGGVEYLPQPAIKLTGALGYAFERNFDFYGGNRPSLGMDDVPFLKLSLDVGW